MIYIIRGQKVMLDADLAKISTCTVGILYNRRSNDKAGKRKKKDMIAVDGNHEPLVTPKQWDLVRMKREKHKGRSKRVEDPERISLLSGLVKCPKCGSGMIAKKNKSVNHNHGGYYKT